MPALSPAHHRRVGRPHITPESLCPTPAPHPETITKGGHGRRPSGHPNYNLKGPRQASPDDNPESISRGLTLLAGVPVHVVATRLGHADPAVTLRGYSHVLREHAAGVGDIFAQAVQSQR